MPERPVAKGFCLEETNKYDSAKVCAGILPRQLLLPKTIKPSPGSENSDNPGSVRPDADVPRTQQQYFILDEGGEFNSKMLENYRLNVTVEVKPAYYQKWARNRGRNSSTDACSFPGIAPRKGANGKPGKRHSIGSGKKKISCVQMDDDLNIKTVYRFRPCKVVPGLGGTQNSDGSKEDIGKNMDQLKPLKSLDCSSTVQELTSQKNMYAFCDSDSSSDDTVDNYTDTAVHTPDRGATSSRVTDTSGGSSDNVREPAVDDAKPDIGEPVLPSPKLDPVLDSKATSDKSASQVHRPQPAMPSYRRRYENPFKSRSEASILSATYTPETSKSPRALEDFRLALDGNKSSRYAMSDDKVYKRECYSKYYHPVQYSNTGSHLATGRKDMLDVLEIKTLQNSIDCPQDMNEKSATFINKVPLKLAQSTPVFNDPDSAGLDFETLRVSHHLKKLRSSRTVPKSAASEPKAPERKDENVVTAADKGFKTVVLGFSMMNVDLS